MQYSEKEIKIFNAVLELSANGHEVYNLTVQEIATQAGIGKGTIYEYFRTKDQILAMTLIYATNNENLRAKEKLDKTDGFKQKVYMLYDFIIDGINNQFSSYNLIMSIGGIRYIPLSMREYCMEVEIIMNKTKELVQEIVECGFKEGLITAPIDSEYLEIVINANLMSIGKASSMMKNLNTNNDLLKTKEYCYHMLIKSLN